MVAHSDRGRRPHVVSELDPERRIRKHAAPRKQPLAV
jgi:hypothetical protein